MATRCLNNMTRYVAGYIFFVKFVDGFLENHVLLIRKNKPVWQAGNYNAIGGKIEEGESAAQAMVRECFEECGIQTRTSDWRNFAKIESDNYEVEFFSTHVSEPMEYESKTSERVDAFMLSRLPENLVRSNKILLAIARDPDVEKATLYYKS